MDQPKDKKPLIEALEDFWAEALGRVSQAEDEAQKLVQKVSQAAGWSQDEVRRLSERLVQQRKSVETGVEETVKRSLQRLKVPRREEVAQLSARLDAVARRLEALSK